MIVFKKTSKDASKSYQCLIHGCKRDIDSRKKGMDADAREDVGEDSHQVFELVGLKINLTIASSFTIRKQFIVLFFCNAIEQNVKSLTTPSDVLFKRPKNTPSRMFSMLNLQ